MSNQWQELLKRLSENQGMYTTVTGPLLIDTLAERAMAEFIRTAKPNVYDERTLKPLAESSYKLAYLMLVEREKYVKSSSASKAG